MGCAITLKLDMAGGSSSLVREQGAGDAGFASIPGDIAGSYQQPLPPPSQPALPHLGGCQRLGHSDCSLGSAGTDNDVG